LYPTSYFFSLFYHPHLADNAKKPAWLPIDEFLLVEVREKVSTVPSTFHKFSIPMKTTSELKQLEAVKQLTSN